MNIDLLHRTKKDWVLLIINHRGRKYAWFDRSISNVLFRAQRFVDGGPQ